MTYHIPQQPTLEELQYIKDWLEFDPETGKLYRFKIKAQIFKEVGAYNNGYLMTKVLGREIYNHHIIWYLYYGKWPSLQIDHEDWNRSNNKIDNLKEVTTSIQNLNKEKVLKNYV